jgi:hypothetical protein
VVAQSTYGCAHATKDLLILGKFTEKSIIGILQQAAPSAHDRRGAVST